MKYAHISWRWPWLILALFTILIIIVILANLLSRNASQKQSQDEAIVFSLPDDLQGEAARRTFQTWRNLSRLSAVLLALSLILASLFAARPSSIDKSLVSERSRDIVLCLDVSGSTLPYDREVLSSYIDLVKNFQGERIALSIFNSTSRTVFPLTDDYDLVIRQLTHAKKILKGVQTQNDIDKMTDKEYQAISDWLEGTQNRKDTTSLIGDGLISCAAMLPDFSADPQQKPSPAPARSSSIVLATDNVVSGKPTYSLEEALKLTTASGINVDGLYSGPKQSEQDPETKQMRQLIQTSGGIFLLQSGGDSITSLVNEIESRHNEAESKVKESSLVDQPRWWTLLLCVLVSAYILLMWRLKR